MLLWSVNWDCLKEFEEFQRLMTGQNAWYITEWYDVERDGRPWTAAQRMIKINQCRGVDFIPTPTSRLTRHYNRLQLVWKASAMGGEAASKHHLPSKKWQEAIGQPSFQLSGRMDEGAVELKVWQECFSTLCVEAIMGASCLPASPSSLSSMPAKQTCW